MTRPTMIELRGMWLAQLTYTKPLDVYWQHTCEAAPPMGWLRLVGSIKLYVSFAERDVCYRALLQKRPIILSILLTKATPYHPSDIDNPIKQLSITWYINSIDFNWPTLNLLMCIDSTPAPQQAFNPRNKQITQSTKNELLDIRLTQLCYINS